MAMKRKNLPDFPTEIFDNELFEQIRYVRPEPDFDPWFFGVDLCRALGYKNTRDALAKHVDSEDKRPGVAIHDVSSNGVVQNRKITVVNESGMYSLIWGSNLPETKKFKRWVTHEVLPSIRKYGYYVAPYQKIIEIKGTENLKAFKAKYPEGAVEVRATFMDADENEYGELGMTYLRYKIVLHSDKLISGEQGRKLRGF